MLHNAGIDVGGVGANHSAHTEKHTIHTSAHESKVDTVHACSTQSTAHSAHTAEESSFRGSQWGRREQRHEPETQHNQVPIHVTVPTNNIHIL